MSVLTVILLNQMFRVAVVKQVHQLILRPLSIMLTMATTKRGVEDPLYFINPLMSQLLKPYSHGKLIKQQQHLSYCLSSTTITVENTIGKSKARLLNKELNVSIGLTFKYDIEYVVVFYTMIANIIKKKFNSTAARKSKRVDSACCVQSR